MRLVAENAEVTVDLNAGGRIASLRVGGMELLVTDGEGSYGWGCYPMAPYAGRVRRGRFVHQGRVHQLPLGMPPHAIHGSVLDRAWSDEGAGRISTSLGPDWPFPGHAVQTFALEPGRLRLRLEVHADALDFPASVGWHPWFRRRLQRGEPAQLELDAGAMYVRDAEGIPTGVTRSPGEGPFDDCFTDVRSDPVLRWPGALELRLHSSCDHWVVYDEPADALCVEPQSGPPDALNIAPRIVRPGAPLAVELELAFRAL